MAKTFLIVDDSASMRQLIAFTIKDAGHEVLLAENGKEALEKLKGAKADMVITDLNMPGMKGEDVMRVVRSEFPQVEIIVITGCGTLESATSGIRYGICDYLQKPFDVVQVTAAASGVATSTMALS